MLDELNQWFAEFGIDPEEHPAASERRLRLALQTRPGNGPDSSTYGVRITTEHTDPEPIIRTAMRVLARQLGPGTSIDLITSDRDVVAHTEQHPFPTTAN